jgi:hypothetical protein
MSNRVLPSIKSGREHLRMQKAPDYAGKQNGGVTFHFHGNFPSIVQVEKQTS